jgi:hypothetical protein
MCELEKRAPVDQQSAHRVHVSANPSVPLLRTSSAGVLRPTPRTPAPAVAASVRLPRSAPHHTTIPKRYQPFAPGRVERPGDLNVTLTRPRSGRSLSRSSQLPSAEGQAHVRIGKTSPCGPTVRAPRDAQKAKSPLPMPCPCTCSFRQRHRRPTCRPLLSPLSSPKGQAHVQIGKTSPCGPTAPFGPAQWTGSTCPTRTIDRARPPRSHTTGKLRRSKRNCRSLSRLPAVTLQNRIVELP